MIRRLAIVAGLGACQSTPAPVAGPAPVAEPVTAPVSAPVAAPVTPVAAPVATPVVSPAATPAGAPVAAPMRSPAYVAPGRDPLCHEFGGMIHGTVSCVTLTLATGVIAPSERRVEPAQSSVECGRSSPKAELVIGTTRLHIVCEFLTSHGEDILVHATATDPAFPALRGRRFDLGHSGGFADDVNVIAARRDGEIDFSVDFITDE
jgi:hypothetical protein